ncbi:MaoC family dehydratase N-terminal domain-containing protein [Alicyclobacillus sp. SO9]|uniref:MaoC family dehydratase N-terminal domain-containing protein n=1 Tax=Alicyclobacillus sp. SO9 TaxID=2665646 RepID=UPI0018E6F33C|nr:MaoC family dehydratase N-terminal domain-containing protein [Alicyclobacillus sp. SO9]QQE77571.1 MaoC family dehydratase N-terminal domain-containing protein [Alicyclobacillus sp. SO9]
MSRFQNFIGKESVPVRNEVEKGAIRKFAEAIGDPNPLYRDESYASATRYGSIVAPPTFSRTFDYGAIEGFDLPQDGLIHGEQGFEYYRPVRPGDVLYCSTKLTRVFDRKGRLGTMTFLIFEYTSKTESGDLVVKGTSSVIYRQGGKQ